RVVSVDVLGGRHAWLVRQCSAARRPQRDGGSGCHPAPVPLEFASLGSTMSRARIEPGKRRPPARPPGVPVVRRGTVRLPGDIAAHVRAGHPWIYREVLGGRPLREHTGDVVELVDPAGDFVARGLYEEDAIIAVRVVS